MTTDRVSCSLRSRELDEPLGGSAAEAVGWVCIEHDGAWSPKAPTAEEIGDVAAAMSAPHVRVQLIRRPRRAHLDRVPEAEDGPPDGLTVLVAHAAVAPADRWLRRLSVADHDELLTTLHPAVTTSPAPPAIGEPVDDDVWLVCAHGRRDACCALHGRPVAAALRDAGAEVWETTHTGGHRFAATAVLLPDGLSLGRLDTTPAVELLTSLGEGALPPALLRGRCALPHAVQAAEAAARIELGIDRRDGLLPSSWSADGARTTVTLAGDDGRWIAVVRTAPATPPRPVSDTAEPTAPDAHELVALDRARDVA